MSAPPTLAQQRGLAFAPIPPAILSAISCSYVIHHLIRKEPKKLKRLYHRLVLAMHITLLVYSLLSIWAPFAIPEGTDYYVAASGTIATCTASAFLFVVLCQAVPVYYASLIVQAFLGIRNNFEEKKYIWIEKWVHILALCPSIAMTSVYAATENLNPMGSTCWVSRAPLGCEADTNTPCERGEDLNGFETLHLYILIFIYFAVVPAVSIFICCWVRKVRRRPTVSTGWNKVKRSIQKEMMRSIAKQTSFYVMSFWLTWVLCLAHTIYVAITHKWMYTLWILSNSIFNLQGFVFAIVYFSLEEMGDSRIKVSVLNKPDDRNHMTVQSIRYFASIKKSNDESETAEEPEKTINFNIFDGVPDESSPWAKFIYGDDDDDSKNDDEPED